MWCEGTQDSRHDNRFRIPHLMVRSLGETSRGLSPDLVVVEWVDRGRHPHYTPGGALTKVVPDRAKEQVYEEDGKQG